MAEKTVSEKDVLLYKLRVKVIPMNKEQLVTKIAEDVGTSKAQANEFFDAFVSVVTETLVNGDNVQLAGLGSLASKTRAATTGRNPRTGEQIQIAEKNVVKFSIAKKLKDAVND